MGHYEDLWWEITDDINNKGLKKEFDAQLAKMSNQDKHKYMDSREKWKYAHIKVVNVIKESISNKKALN
tara:strand:+ start:1296 stop:1502 length:207 start_codon:yes stop_codon:yes gene_type:complete